MSDASDIDIYMTYMYQKSNFEYSNTNTVGILNVRIHKRIIQVGL